MGQSTSREAKSRAANRRSAAKDDVPALCTIARPEIAMIIEERDENGFREGPRESFDALLLHAGIAMRHRNRRGGTFGAGNEQPTPQRRAALDRELDIPSFGHRHLLFSLCGGIRGAVSLFFIHAHMLLFVKPRTESASNQLVRSDREKG
jgi:hypothetical protein